MSLRSSAIAAVGLFASLGLAACGGDNRPNFPNQKVAESQPQTPANIGDPLFKFAPWMNPPVPEQVVADPVVLPLCHLTVIDKQDVPSQVDGVLAFVGIELTANDPVPDARETFVHPRTGKKYRKLRVGEIVGKKQEVVFLDDLTAELEHRIADSGLKAAHADVTAADKTITHVVTLMAIAKQAWDKGAGSFSDFKAAEANVARYESEKVAKMATVKKAEGELERAGLRLKFHTISPSIQGTVAAINKEPGEGVKANEPILQINNLDRLRVEGYIELQYTPRVQKGMEVAIEPTVPLAPLQTHSVHKSRQITAIAVSNNAQRPLILSGGEDGMVYVWDRSRSRAAWAHRGVVRTITCTGRDAKESLALIGADDGVARIWDLNKLSDTPLRELSEKNGDESVASRHPGGVTASAFSPTGEYCVTADAERNIYLWKTATGEKLYRFPAEHTSPVSALSFTPQCRVISVGKDNVVHIWKVGDKSAAVERSFEHRSGEVTNLGVTDDGNWMALDHDKTRLHLVHVGKGLTESVVHSMGDSTHFSSFALLSPALNAEGNRLGITASNQGRIIQLWRRAPAEDRIREIRRLVTTNNVPATVAAFSPYAENGFVVVGTEKGDIHLWALPSVAETERRWTGRITHIDPSVEPTGRSVKIWAELKNDPEGPTRLKPGTTAAMVIRPAK